MHCYNLISANKKRGQVTGNTEVTWAKLYIRHYAISAVRTKPLKKRAKPLKNKEQSPCTSSVAAGSDVTTLSFMAGMLRTLSVALVNWKVGCA
jgi:hypothetical protein